MRHSTSRFRTLTVIPPSGASIFFQRVATLNACNPNPVITFRMLFNLEKKVTRHLTDSGSHPVLHDINPRGKAEH